MPRSTLAQVRRVMRDLADDKRAATSQWFFKTGPGEYAEGDRFLGITVPEIRRVARAHRELSLRDTLSLLRSKWHEERLLALVLLVDAYDRGSADERNAIFDAYLANTEHIDNWDLVDASAGRIVGPHLRPTDSALLDRLAQSNNLWERRIEIVAPSHFIREHEF